MARVDGSEMFIQIWGTQMGHHIHLNFTTSDRRAGGCPASLFSCTGVRPMPATLTSTLLIPSEMYRIFGQQFGLIASGHGRKRKTRVPAQRKYYKLNDVSPIRTCSTQTR